MGHRLAGTEGGVFVPETRKITQGERRARGRRGNTEEEQEEDDNEKNDETELGLPKREKIKKFNQLLFFSKIAVPLH